MLKSVVFLLPFCKSLSLIDTLACVEFKKVATAYYLNLSYLNIANSENIIRTTALELNTATNSTHPVIVDLLTNLFNTNSHTDGLNISLVALDIDNLLMTVRDMKTDAVNRVTVAIKLGMKGARIYQTILVTLGWALILVFCAVYDFAPGHYIFIITLPLYIKHLQGVWTRSERALDPMLPMLVISTFFLSILAGAGFLIF